MNKRNAAACLATILIAGCATTNYEAPLPKINLSPDEHECVSLETSKGEITLALYKKLAPISVENFLSYTNDNFYDGTIFHRVIENFIVQGGGFDENKEKKITKEPIESEADNGLLNIRGSVATARKGDPHSATAQFFINNVDNPFLNHREKTMRGWGYTVFGRVVGSMDVVDNIRKVPTGPSGNFSKDVPIDNVVIIKAKVISCNDVKQGA